MIRYCVCAFLGAMVLPASLVGQTSASRAVRDDGSVVWLLPDKTWTTTAPSQSGGESSATGRRKPASATVRVPILKQASISFDRNKWRQTENPQPGRLNFVHSTGDGYVMIISERLQVSPDALVQVAITNARNVAPDTKVIQDEPRVVNGVPVRCLVLDGTMQGIKFRFFGYYYAGAAGSIQVVTYTSDNLYTEYKADFEEFLDGFEVVQ